MLEVARGGAWMGVTDRKRWSRRIGHPGQPQGDGLFTLGRIPPWIGA